MKQNAPIWIPAIILMGAAGVIAISLPHQHRSKSAIPAENEIRDQTVKVRVRLNEIEPLPGGGVHSLIRWSVSMKVVKVTSGDPAILGRAWTFLVHSPSRSFMADPKPGDEFDIILPGYPEQPYSGDFEVADTP